MSRFTCLTLVLLLAACGADTGDSTTDTGTSTVDPATTGTTAPDTTGDGPTATPTTGEPPPTTSTTTDSSGPGDTAADVTTADATTADATTADATTADATTADATTGELAAFDRFRLDSSAGPCPPDADCDGFIELLADGTLRVEKFGDVQDNVTELQISQDDLDAAAPVFADPALFALLAQDDIPCMPPTDVFERMELDVAGDVVMNQTTACTQPPLVAARGEAQALADKYVP